MEIESQLLSIGADVSNANGVKELVIGQLYRDGKITEDTAKEYSENWQIIVFKRSWFALWAKVFGHTNTESWQYKFVKFEDKKQL